jgi:flavin-dependent dehydrogenase
MGSAQLPTPVPTYQIDRGRFENHLRELNNNAGITFLDECYVKSIKIADCSVPNSRHEVIATCNGLDKTFQSRWIVDATGRFGLLKRKLGLSKEVGHRCNAAWFRVKSEIDINTWSQNQTWQKRSPLGQRRFSTNHLMGKGYWVWLIPLASGSTSIGIVADPEFYGPAQIKTFEDSMCWLRKYEPQCAKAIDPFKDKIQDFLFLKNFAHGCEQVYSSDRWFLTGEAGVFSDAFYSPGSDFIGISNSYITDLIVRDMKGENIDARIKTYNDIYLHYFDLVLSHYEGHYGQFGNAYIMMQKILWDTVCAFSIPYVLFFKKKLWDLDFMDEIGNNAMKLYKDHTSKVQSHFKKMMTNQELPILEKVFLNFSDIMHSGYFSSGVYRQLYTKYSDQALKEKLRENMMLIENLANDILNNKSILPSWVLDGEGHNHDLWKATSTRLTIAMQNNWS